MDHLERVANMVVADKDRAHMQEVLDTYPVRLSLHTIRQMLVSQAVGYQYLPFIEELDTVGHVNTWVGQFHQGLLEQMYPEQGHLPAQHDLPGVLQVLLQEAQGLAR